MAKERARFGRPVARGGPPSPIVRLRLEEDRLELTFTRGFTTADLALVKAIPGRRFDPERRVWVLPPATGTVERLERGLGGRLVVTGGRGDGRKGPRPAERASSSSDPARDQDAPRRDLDALVDSVRQAIRARGYSPRTGRAYVGWVRRFSRFRGQATSRPEELDASLARAFLDHLATNRRLAPGSRNQAASALAFMFREVFGRDELAEVPRAKGPKRAPVVLTHREVLRVLHELTGKYFLAAVLLYSAGLRLDECLRLRVKDIDFELRQILLRDGKGRKDRYVPLARRAVALLHAQIGRVAALHRTDRAKGHGWAELPGALHRKDPSAGYELRWQYLFPAATTNPDPATGRIGRRPLHATAVQRQVKAAVRRSGIPKRATCHTFRHSFATEALRGGCDIRTLQQVMGHRDVRTTMIYLHVVEQSGLQLRSPLDRPDDLDDFDPDPIGSPGGQSAAHWELAQRQWHADGRGGKPASRSHRRRRSAEPDEPPEGGPDRRP